MTDRIQLLLDVDTGIDDSMALLYAAASPEVDIIAVTCVAGNVDARQVAVNTLAVLELAGRGDVEVALGRETPLVRPLETTPETHGPRGLGYAELPKAARGLSTRHAVDLLIEEARRAPGELTLVTLGPLTNVAAAFERAPDAARLLRSLVLMGGTSDAVGNVTSVAEFNIWADVEAAAVVFESGAPITMVGWDISRKYAVFGPEDAAALRALGPLGVFSVDIQRTLLRFALQETGLGGFDLPDPIAMGIALEPTIAVDVEHVHVAVERRGELTRGQTVIDHRARFGEANVDVVFAASRDRFIELLHDSLRP